ncbi:MAG TPA: nitroreductase family protein [Acidimicrobiales bacterium]|nr:nitroreductase family protein [Acidimicrobiales bacterium]
MDLLDALRSTGAAREFEDEPVPDEVVYRLIDTARFAANGGNRQAWRVVVLRDPKLRRRVRDCYLPGWYEYLAQVAVGLCPWAPVTDEEAERAALAQAPEVATRAAAGGGGFAEHLEDVPVLLVLLADLRKLAAVDRDFDRYTLVGGASIYPFAWSLLLAARAEGLGGVMTTMATRREPEILELLGAPAHMAVAAVIALGRPSHQPTRLRRAPVGEFTTVDSFDGPALAEGAGPGSSGTPPGSATGQGAGRED